MIKGNFLKKLNKNNNSGSVMIMVLVAFLFVSILVAIIFSTVSVNIKMRSIDRRTKDEFYYAEKALNEIYTGLGQDCSEQMGKSYNTILSSYKKAGNNGYNYKVQEAAYNGFVVNFLSAMNTNVFSKKEQKFNDYIVKDVVSKNSPSAYTGRAKLKSSGRIRYYADHDRRLELFPTSSDFTDAGSVRCIAIEDVSVISNPDAQANIGYVSEITTDIVINIPSIDFFNLNNGQYDFAIAANDGLYFMPGSQGIINGNVYGGTISYLKIKNDHSDASDSTVYGGINVLGASVSINDAEYVISGGDINVVSTDNKLASFTVKSGGGKNNQIWFENLVVRGKRNSSADATATVNIEGNLLSSGDLQIDADRANVVVKGSYYGYNDGTVEANSNLSNKEAFWKKFTNYTKVGANNENPAARSSSIIINGSNDVLDMNELNTLLLMGNAYINHESKQGNSDDTKNVYVEEGKIDAGKLPESVALKSSQGLILMPTAFLKISNPAPYTGGGDPFIISTDINTKNWFGKDFIDTTNNHKTVKLRQGSRYYAYCYLNFKDGTVSSGKYAGMPYRDAYVQAIIEGDNTGESPTAAEIRKEISSIVQAYNSIVSVGNTESRIYAKSSILGYDSASGLYRVSNNASNSLFSNYSDNLYKRYRLLDTYLEPLKDTPLSSSTGVKGIDERDLTTEDNEMPMARFFWLSGLRDAINNRVDGGYNEMTKALCYKFEDNDNIKFVLLRSLDWGGVKYSIDLATVTDQNGDKIFDGKTNAIVLIDGDAYVSTGEVDINGYVACQGKITVNEGAKLKVTYDASVVNKRIGKELQLLEQNGGFSDNIQPKNNETAKQWLIYYLLNTDSSSFDSSNPLYKLKKTGNNISKSNGEIKDYRIYGYSSASENGITKQKYDVDYTNYIYFDNWTKGQQ